MFGAPLRTFVLADTGSYLSPIICNEELVPRLDVHVCVGSPFNLYGVSNVVYSHTPLYHYKPAYPQRKAWYEFLRGTGYLIWPAGWQPCISLRPINRRDSCLFYPRSLLGYSQLSVDQGLSTSPNTSEHPLTEEYLWLKRYIANDCIVLPVS